MAGKDLISGVLALALLAGQSTAVHAEVVPLAPATPWAMDYAEDSCSLRREFGTGDDRVILEMEQFAPGKTDIQFTVIGPETRWRNRLTMGNARIRFLPDAEGVQPGGLFQITAADDWHGVSFSSSLIAPQLLREEMPEEQRALLIAAIDQTERARQVTGIELQHVLGDDLLLQTGSMRAPMAAMATCLDELLTHWGIDAEAHHHLQQAVIPLEMETWARRVQAVYPHDMVQQGQQAILRIRLDVTTEGTAGGCHMQSRIGHEDFAQTACNILRGNARFSPALDAAGNPIASYYLLTIYYSMG